MKFSEKLKALRQKKGLTQAELAEKSEIPQTTIAHWESGNRSPSFEGVRAIAKALGVNCRHFEDCTFPD